MTHDPQSNLNFAQQEQALADNGAPETCFEDSVRRLGTIVEQLETGDLPLEESLKLFEEGVRLARASQARLDAAEKRVEELLLVDANGKPIVRQIDTE
jgi:exodeoxyribonuclease VII small subunit